LAVIRQADDTTAALGAAALDQFTSGIPRLLAEADRIGSRLSMMFARRGTKDPAELRQLNAAVPLDTQPASRHAARISGVRRAERYPPAAIDAW